MIGHSTELAGAPHVRSEQETTSRGCRNAVLSSGSLPWRHGDSRRRRFVNSRRPSSHAVQHEDVVTEGEGFSTSVTVS
ncbi:hypothetical protein IscW_ISCW002910 [Ixodes scapularis]|uniref:Uncharacterized protein n=1 Tax=Ixodes scapularis TaxID=6945 RepID=B7PB01_IXOSC|nr:hypothetical protein IscW_ISCW002910 [Ixodes scapularis]|eukprot:XP_002407523.1 hypothetical protein IscW_ISCW002910 [Ixodes scapularis]